MWLGFVLGALGALTLFNTIVSIMRIKAPRYIPSDSSTPESLVPFFQKRMQVKRKPKDISEQELWRREQKSIPIDPL